MATPLTASAKLAALRAEGVRVTGYKDWSTHNRNHKGSWGGVNGVTIHHTAGVSSGMVDLCYRGYDRLPGPICHDVLTKAARCYSVGHGRANHAGRFARNAHDAVVAEAPLHPYPDAYEPIDGNQHYYGLEIENEGDGQDPYPPDQYDQAVRYAAAICRAHGWTEHSVIGHREGTRRKIDPSFNMVQFRRDVAERLKHPAGWNPQEEDMALTESDLDTFVHTDGVLKSPHGPEHPNRYWTLESYQYETYRRVKETKAAAEEALVTALANKAAISELAKALAAHHEEIDPEALVQRIEASIEGISIELNVTD